MAAATGGAVVGLVVQFAVAQKLLEAGHELAAKEGAQDMDRKEEIARCRDPVALVACQAA